MKVHNKIGFHTAVGGNPTGIGDYVRQLDAKGIPACIVCADGTTGISDIVALWENGSTVPHVVCWRRVIGPANADRSAPEHYSVPKYHDPPPSAAKDHWAIIEPTIPPEIARHKDKIWLLPINEIDKNRCDWLGQFAVHFAKIANAAGYKVSMFAWSSGEPEREGWEQPGMLDYLRYCEQNPDMAAVALHEYSYVKNNIKDGFPNKIGRFQLLFDVCAVHDIARPRIHITEWGWTLNDVPGPTEAIKDMEEIGELYAQHPEIEGAAIWYLGPEFGHIANKAQKLIKPTTEFTLRKTFNVSDAPPPLTDVFRTATIVAKKRTVSKPAQGGEPRPTPARPVAPPLTPPKETLSPIIQPNALFIADITIPDDSRIPAGTTFTKTWRVRNTGNISWGGNIKLVHIRGDRMGATSPQPVTSVVHPGNLGDISVDFTVPAAAGTHFSDWQLQDNQGNFFGDVLFTRIISEAESPPVNTGTVNARFIADVTIPDDMQFITDTPFTKTWRLQNTGTRAWGTGFTLSFLGGDRLTDQTAVAVPVVAAGAQGDVSVVMATPSTAGTYTSYWRMKDDRGNFFGDEVYVRIIVNPAPDDEVQVTLQTGMNINPDAPHSNPMDSNALQGADWVRFVFKLAARENVSERDDINAAFNQFDEIIQKYDQKNVKSLIVLNQETVWGNAPWTGNNNWQEYGNRLAVVARQIAGRYRRYGDRVAYEIWNEGDLPHNPASVYVPPAQFAPVLRTVAGAIREASPDSPLVFGGLATGPAQSVAYLQQCLAALGGSWPVDAIGIHPYGRWATRAPFDWGTQFGTLADAFARYRQAFPTIPFWITEVGVAADNEIGPQYYAEIADYIQDVHQHIAAEYTTVVPVIIWFAWSDWMRNAGVVRTDGSPKAHAYDAYQSVIKA